MRATALSLADRKTVSTPRSSASRASSAVMAAPRPWRREDGSTPTPVISATPSPAWQLPAASGPSGPNAAASTECPDRSRSRSIAIVPPSWSAAILSRSAAPAAPAAVPGWPNATAGTAQIRSSSASSGAMTRTVVAGGSAGAAPGADSTMSGCAWTSSPAAAGPGVVGPARPGRNEKNERPVLVGPGPAAGDGVAERVNPLDDLVSSHSSTHLKVPSARDQLRLPAKPRREPRRLVAAVPAEPRRPGQDLVVEPARRPHRGHRPLGAVHRREPLRAVAVRPGRGRPRPLVPRLAEQPVRGPGQGQLAELGAAVRGLPGQRLQRGGRAQVAGAVVEELARHRARAPVIGLRHRDAARRLDDAVEAAPAAPRPPAAPRREAHHHQAGLSLRQDLRAQPEPVQGVRAVPVHQDVGAGEQFVQPGGALGGTEVEQRAALADEPVVDMLRQLGPVWRVEPEHLRAERAEVPGGHRSGDDPGEV